MTRLREDPLGQFEAATGNEFVGLREARTRTISGLGSRRETLKSLESDPDVSIVLMGSWGRAEVTRGSDDDFMVLINGPSREVLRPDPEDVATLLDVPPGDRGIFGSPVSCEDLAENIGLDDDSNSNLTRRILLLTESTYGSNPKAHSASIDRVLARYLDQSVKSHKPPRFLLNDVVRYWRTMCVDFAGNEKSRPGKWGIRNAKLRTSRKLLFAGALVPILRCGDLEVEEMSSFLRTQFSMPPVDRLAEAFLHYDALDAGEKALGAYDSFIQTIDNVQYREELSGLTRDTVGESKVFTRVAQYGEDLQHGMESLLFEADTELARATRSYGIF